MYSSMIALVCLVAVASARPQVTEYSDITDENDPRFGFDPNPQYLFKYQVSDENEQTYVAHDENRDGASVVGQYSYVDPFGSLIIVKYTADENGYSETRESQENFVTIRAKPKKEIAIVDAPRPAPSVLEQRTPAPQTDSNLVANIIAQLIPFIKESVSNSLETGTTSGRFV